MLRRLPVPAADLLVAAICLGFAWAELLVWDEWSSEPHALQAVAVSVGAGALALRRRAPLVAAATLAGAVLLLAIGGTPPQLFALGVAGVIVAYAVGALLDGRQLAAGVVLLGTALLTRDITDPDLNGADIAIDAVWFALPLALGRVVRRRERRVELVAQAAAEQASDAVARERARIARELHDVVAHGLSVMVVQADAARHCLDPSEHETRAALAEIERTGRQSLREMRRLLGLLRDADDDVELGPQPGLAAVEELVQSVRQAGLDVELRVAGAAQPLSPGVDLAAYRIVQEALTNALRHGGHARAVVEIAFAPREVSLRVEDTGGGPVAAPGGAGHGLVGMRERALLYGGSFAAAPSGSGYVVSATLPLEPAR